MYGNNISQFKDSRWESQYFSHSWVWKDFSRVFCSPSANFSKEYTRWSSKRSFGWCKHCRIRSVSLMKHIWLPWKLANFKTPHLLVYLRPNTFHPLDLERPISNELPFPNDNQSFKRKHDPRMSIICYQESSFSLKDGFTIWSQSQKEDFLSIMY